MLEKKSIKAEFSSNILDIIPDFLKSLNRWLLWEAIKDDRFPEKKPKKIPLYVNGKQRSGVLGGEEDLSCLTSLTEAVEEAKIRQCGIGFAFIDGDNITGIDLDNCIDLETGEFSELSLKICSAANSYTEISPSWKGLHIIVKGKCDSIKCSEIEMYSQGRYFCFTGNRLDEYSSDVNEVSVEFLKKLSNTAKKKRDEERISKTIEKEWKPINKNFSDNDQQDIDLICEALNVLNADIYDDWVTTGMALKARFGDAGYDIWYRWSSTSLKFKASEMTRKWISFKRTNGIGIGSIFKRAEDAGWKRQKQKQKNISKETCNTTLHIEGETKNIILSEWPDPIDILSDVRPPSVKLELIPSVIADFISDQAEMIGCDPCVMVGACLVACAGALSDNVKISPKRFHNGWLERACLWGAFVGLPSEKKTPAMNAAFRPLREIEKGLAEKRKIETERYNDELEAYRRRGKDSSLEKPVPPERTQFVVGAATIESLQQIIAENKRGVTAVYDELSGWFGAMDAYNKSGSSKDRPAWLELYNGGAKSFNTVSRGEIWVSNWSASIFGNIHPDAIKKISSSLPEDGLLQRFFVLCNTKSSSVGVDRPPKEEVKKKYSEFIHWLLKVDGDEYSFIELSDEAMAVKESLYEWARGMLRAEFIKGGIASHVGKYEGLFARLLIIWHCADSFEKRKWTNVVCKEVAEKCATFLKEFLFPHAVFFYARILNGEASDHLIKRIARTLLTVSESSINNRGMARKCREWQKMTEAQKADTMQALDTLGWVSAGEIPLGKKIPREWRVNPIIKEKFSDLVKKETERIQESKKILHRIFPEEKHLMDFVREIP